MTTFFSVALFVFDPILMNLVFVMLFTMAVALWQWTLIPRPRTMVFTLLGIIIVFALALETYGTITMHMYLNNSVVYNIAILVEAWLLMTLMGTLWHGRKVIIVLGYVGVTAGMVANFAIVGHVDRLLSYGALVIALVLTFLSMAILWHMAQTSEDSLLEIPEFWLVLALLIFFGGVVPIISVVELIYQDDPYMAARLYQIVPALAAVRYLLLAFACWMARQERKVFSRG